jgi:hypothetical protein
MYYKKKDTNNKSYNELKEENNELKKTIESLNQIIQKLQSQNNQNFMRNSIIIENEYEEDKIEKNINILKSMLNKTNENWKKALRDIIALEEEIEVIKNRMKDDFEKFKKEYQEQLKKTLENQYDEKMKQEFQKISDCFNKKIDQTIRKMEERSQKQFGKLYNKNKVNEIEKKQGYSFICVNSDKLKVVINEGDDEAKMEITLKNNGSLVWKEDKSILGFDRESKRSGDEIKLNPQKPGEENSYNIFLKSLKSSKPGEYPIILKVFIDNETIGEEINGKLIIKKKEN